MMKTLQQIEPRTPISSLPFTISSPGSYYVTGPLNSTNFGITVTSSDVTIDLMGFTIGGAQNTNHPGIHIAGANDVMVRNVVIRNGGITRFGKGILVENTQGGSLRGLIVHQNTASGIVISRNAPGICSDIRVEDCTITDNAGHGVVVEGNGDPGPNRSHTIRNNTISGNSKYGLFCVYAYGCLIDGNVFGPQVPIDGDAYAIYSGVGRNLIVRNFSLGNTNQIGTSFLYISGSDTYGPTLISGGQLSLTNGHPWWNFSR